MAHIRVSTREDGLYLGEIMNLRRTNSVSIDEILGKGIQLDKVLSEEIETRKYYLNGLVYLLKKQKEWEKLNEGEAREIERERAIDILNRKNRVLSTKNTELEVDNLVKEFEIRLLKTAFGAVIKGIVSKDVAVILFDESMQEFRFRLSKISIGEANLNKVYIKQIRQDFKQIESELERRIRTEQKWK